MSKILKLTVMLHFSDGKHCTALIDHDGQVTIWPETPLESREAAKLPIEAIWLALSLDGFMHKQEKPSE